MSEYLFKTDREIMTCQECPIVKKYRLGTICPLREGAERRYGTCPLGEVQSHGDLIDRQKLLGHRFEVYDSNEEVCEDYIETYHVLEAPAIIEASKERDNG